MTLSANVELGANADADSDSALLDLFGKIRVGVETLVSQQARAEQREQEALQRLPVVSTIERFVDNITGTTIVEFDGPMPGRQWHVRMLSGVASPLAANASLVTWYVGQRMPGPAAGMLPSTMARWQFAALPAFEDFSKLTMVIYPGQRLIAGLTGVPAASNIALTATINDYPYPGAVE